MDRKIYDFKQSSIEWHQIRLGKITSSKFDDVMKKGRKKGVQFGDTAMKYMYSLIAERLTGGSEDINGNALDWGNDYEPLARRKYEERTWNEVQQIGFCTYGDYVGCSTDGLVDDDGMIEIKCPFSSRNHVNYRLNGVPKQYVAQIQGGLWVTGRKWCDFISFDNRFTEQYKIYIQRIERDEDYINVLENRINDFIELYKELIQKL